MQRAWPLSAVPCEYPAVFECDDVTSKDQQVPRSGKWMEVPDEIERVMTSGAVFLPASPAHQGSRQGRISWYKFQPAFNPAWDCPSDKIFRLPNLSVISPRPPWKPRRQEAVVSCEAKCFITRAFDKSRGVDLEVLHSEVGRPPARSCDTARACACSYPQNMDELVYSLIVYRL